MNYKHLLLILTVFISLDASSQIFRYRLGGNSAIFISQPGGSEILHPQSEMLTYPGSSDFSPGFRIGAEAELMAPVTSYFEVGLEFDYTNLSGFTETAPLYNFFLTAYNPLPDANRYPEESLIYKTKQYSILATSRLYFLPFNNKMNIYVKALGGVAFTGTDFTFQDPFYRVEYDVGVLYARGTRNSEYPKKAAFSGGAGVGLTYEILDDFSVYIDGVTSFINSDIIDGVPDFDYIVTAGIESFEPAPAWAMVGKVSIGLIYSAVPDRRLNRGSFTKSRSIRKKPFWKRSRFSPFGKR
jgi:hypothetical protein